MIHAANDNAPVSESPFDVEAAEDCALTLYGQAAECVLWPPVLPFDEVRPAV